MRSLYRLDELKTLKKGDRVFVDYSDNESDIKFISEIVDVSDDKIHFRDQFNFPINRTPDIKGEYAVQESKDFTMCIYQLLNH